MQDDPEKGKVKQMPAAPESPPASGRDSGRSGAKSSWAKALKHGVDVATERTALLTSFEAVTDKTTVLTYDPMDFADVGTIATYKGTIFAQKVMWSIGFLYMCIIGGVTVGMYFYTKHPDQLRTETLTKVVKAAQMLIGFLIGLFLSACVTRWWNTIKSLEKIFGTCKKLVILANNLNLETQGKELLARRVVLSLRCLEKEVNQLNDQEWKDQFAKMTTAGEVSPYEVDLLLYVPADQRSFFTWSLVSAMLKKVQPAVDPLSFDRISSLVLDGLSATSAMKTLMGFQFPFLYVHMLAFMVHVCNLLVAIGTGINMGRIICLYRDGGVFDASNITNEFVFFLLQTFFSMAALFIGASLSFPVGSHHGAAMYQIPLAGMVGKLDVQLKTLIKLSDRSDTDVIKLPDSPYRTAKPVKQPNF